MKRGTDSSYQDSGGQRRGTGEIVLVFLYGRSKTRLGGTKGKIRAVCIEVTVPDGIRQYRPARSGPKKVLVLMLAATLSLWLGIQEILTSDWL